MPPVDRRRTSALIKPARRLLAPVLVALVLLLPALVLYWPTTVGGQTLVPYDALLSDPVFRPALQAEGISHTHNGLIADLVYQNDVWKRYLAEVVGDGEVPLWSPHLFAGLPFLAAAQHSALYPSSWLFLVLDPARAFGWNALLAMWLAGVTCYSLGRALRLGRIASVLMGLSWSLSLPLFVNTVFPMIQGVWVWTPLILAGIESVVSRADSHSTEAVLPRGRTTGWLVTIALATALAAFSGHVEMLYYTTIVAATFSLFRLIELVRASGVRATAIAALWLLIAAVAGGLIACVQLVPFAELASTNWRSGSESYETIVGYAYGVRQLATFVVPDFYGNPAHHAVWDIVRGKRIELADHSMWGTAWGTKNYVEAAAYLGVLPMLLAALGLVAGTSRRLAWFVASLGAVSLSFAFGLPTYRILFLGLPGFDQLHTPFRWVFPFALCIVVLVGMGADRLFRRDADSTVPIVLGSVSLLFGASLGILLWVAFQVPDRWVDLVEAVMDRLPGATEAAQTVFPDMGAFASYQFWNLTHLALFATLAGTFVLMACRVRGRARARTAVAGFGAAVIALDLMLIATGFHPSLDAELAHIQPATTRWLNDATGAKWGRVVGFGDDKVLWPNSAMRSSVPDIRGYDSIIPWWTADTLNSIYGGGTDLENTDQRHGMLSYNRVGNLKAPDQLLHPGLSALGVRYVVTTEELDSPELRPVFADPDGRTQVFEMTRAMPRAWVVDEVQVVEDRSQLLLALGAFDPSRTALLEEEPEPTWHRLESGRNIRRPTTANVREDTETNNTIEVEVSSPTDGMLVVSEAWFPGWRAEVLAAGSDEAIEVPLYRANGMLRAVPVPPGLSTVKIRYSPMSVKTGLYFSFLGAVLLLLAVAYSLWDRFVRVRPGDEVGRVAVNISGPMGISLLNKVIDFVFAMLMLRVLGSANAGSYYYAISVIGLAEILANFGLNVYTAREVAQRPVNAPRVLANTTAARVLLWMIALPLIVGFIALETATGNPVGPETALAILLLAIALLPGSLSAGISAVFQGRERLMVPASVSVVSTLLKVSVGAFVLLAGYGFVGLAGVSIVTNVVTLCLLVMLAWRDGIQIARRVSAPVMWSMAVISLPLMLNHLLQTVFFRIDVLLLQRFQGAEVVGWYSTAYKWIDALLIIPPAVTMALFPLLSRRAEDDREGMSRAYVRALRLLIAFSLPVAAATTFAAEMLIGVLGGREFLPHGATALQIMIWFLPLSFVNGLTQYVLVALDRRRWITGSFAVAATFNIVANWLVIPKYSYGGAAVVTILSEIVLMLPFMFGLRGVGVPPILELAWRPAIATSLMAVLLGVLDSIGVPVLVSLPIGGALYIATLLGLGGIPSEDRAVLAKLLPGVSDSGGGSTD